MITDLILLRMRKCSDRSCRENQNTFYVHWNFFPPENRAGLWDNVETFCTAGTGYRWQYNMARTLCVLDN